MPDNPIVYLIDGTAYIHRAYHAIRGLTSSSGMPTNAVFGFSRMLLNLVEQKQPDYMVMFFDSKGPTFRHDMYSDYKANRPPMPEDMAVQIPWIKKVTEGFRIPIIEMPGYEADDLIGTLSRKAQEAGFGVVMVTGDKDFMQLVTDRAMIWDPMKDEIIDVEKGSLAVGDRADVVIIDPDAAWTIDAAKFYSKSRNCPYDGWELTGRAASTIVGGVVQFELGD